MISGLTLYRLTELTVVPAKVSAGGEGGGGGTEALEASHGGGIRVSIAGGGGGGGAPLIQRGRGLERPDWLFWALPARLSDFMLDESLSLLCESIIISLSLDNSYLERLFLERPLGIGLIPTSSAVRLMRS